MWITFDLTFRPSPILRGVTRVRMRRGSRAGNITKWLPSLVAASAIVFRGELLPVRGGGAPRHRTDAAESVPHAPETLRTRHRHSAPSMAERHATMTPTRFDEAFRSGTSESVPTCRCAGASRRWGGMVGSASSSDLIRAASNTGLAPSRGYQCSGRDESSKLPKGHFA